MASSNERSYRRRIFTDDLVSFSVVVKETDLWISTTVDLRREATDLVLACREQLESYIRRNPEFRTTLEPYPSDSFAPAMVKQMIGMTRKVGVGPMAAVAGAIAEYVGKGLLRHTDRVVVENGGDIFVCEQKPLTVGLFAEGSPFSERLGLRIPEQQTPIGVCSSSGTFGHSLSLGSADIVSIVSPWTALADAAATAIGNRVRREEPLERLAGWVETIEGIAGGVVMVGSRMLSWGNLELVEL